VQTDNLTEETRLISGTYCHPDLVPHIACWISEVFAFKVSKIINNYMVQDYKTTVAAAEGKLVAEE